MQSSVGEFTVDVTSDVLGQNSLCPKFFSKEDNVFDKDLAGEKVWCNPPFKEDFILSFLRHYQECKKRNPEYTSVTLVLPVWSKAAWWPAVRDWKPLRFFPKGTPLFSVPTEGDGPRQKAAPTRWPVVVLYDGPEVKSSPSVQADVFDKLLTCSANE